MKKFMYINDVTDGSMLINVEHIVYVDRKHRAIKMLDKRIFTVKSTELDEILTELERRC